MTKTVPQITDYNDLVALMTAALNSLGFVVNQTQDVQCAYRNYIVANHHGAVSLMPSKIEQIPEGKLLDAMIELYPTVLQDDDELEQEDEVGAQDSTHSNSGDDSDDSDDDEDEDIDIDDEDDSDDEDEDDSGEDDSETTESKNESEPQGEPKTEGEPVASEPVATAADTTEPTLTYPSFHAFLYKDNELVNTDNPIGSGVYTLKLFTESQGADYDLLPLAAEQIEYLNQHGFDVTAEVQDEAEALVDVVVNTDGTANIDLDVYDSANVTLSISALIKNASQEWVEVAALNVTIASI